MFLPIGDSPNPRCPWVTYGLIALNVLVFLACIPQMLRQADSRDPHRQRYVELVAREVVNMVGAALAGPLIPLLLQRLVRDPAQSASIFLATVTDVVGFAAMLGFAVPFLGALTAP